MNKLIVMVCLSLFLYSCGNTNQNAETEEVSPTAITCNGIGLVNLSDNKKSLEEKFSAEDLQDESREIRGEKRNTTIVFPNTPEELTVVWEDDSQEKMSTVFIWNENGPYATKEGLRVGISLRDVVKLNNYLSVSFTNFYSSMDGYANILGFNGGEIEEKYPCLSGKLDIVRLKGVDKLKLDEFKKQDSVSSGDPMVQNMDVKISEISINAQ